MFQVRFGPQVCGDLEAGGQREWLIADGRGGYAMGTVSGLRTRRYHGLLVVAGDPPAQRRVALAALDPVLTLPGGGQVRLGTHEWATGVLAPAGYTLLAEFDLTDGVPRWRWRVGDVVYQRELAGVPGRPYLAVVDRLLAGGPLSVAVQALGTWRDAHGERGAGGPTPAMTATADGVVIEESYRLAGPGWRPTGVWWHDVHHREEAARGLAATEDLWFAGEFQAELTTGAQLEICAWADNLAAAAQPAIDVVAATRRRHRTLTAGRDVLTAGLRTAAETFTVTTESGPDVIAGYPWFGAWSRDTMISYEGLFLATGRTDEGRALLSTYAATLSEGMLANTADTGALTYNTADATLWFIHAAARHVAVTGDTDLAVALLPQLRTVVEAHQAGTRYGIRVDPADGLLTQGADGEALTWMDARIDGLPVTPRVGKAVEINALWVNALGSLAALATAARADRAAESWRRSQQQTAAAFRRSFPTPTGDLADVAGEAARCRPNQLLAYSLPYAPLRPQPEQLQRVASRLLTPLGLRSLAPDEPGYRGRHRGGPAGRDEAYHQGTVWPWLLGPYADACVRAGLPVDGLLDAVTSHLSEWGLGSVSETTDGDPPHAATGCPFQAWSVAEVLRHC